MQCHLNVRWYAQACPVTYAKVVADRITFGRTGSGGRLFAAVDTSDAGVLSDWYGHINRGNQKSTYPRTDIHVAERV